MGPCDENALVEYADGLMASERAASLVRHLDSCSSCRRVLASLLRTMRAAGEPPPPSAPSLAPNPISPENLTGQRLPRESIRSNLALLPSPDAHAVRRLVHLCAALGSMMLVGALIRYVGIEVGGVEQERARLVSGTIQMLTLAAMTFAMAIYARRASNVSRVLSVALAYEVLLCLGLAVMDHIRWDFYVTPPKLSFISVALLAFPIVIPTTPRKRVITTLVCCAMLPVGGIVTWLAFDRPAPANLPFSYLPTLLAAGVALIVSRAVHYLSEQAREARRLGSYELIERIGRGGMGDVWLARHHMLARPAAIKLINPLLLGGDLDEARLRFHREAQVTSALRSPHTVALYDYGVSDRGEFYYAMEFLDGIDLNMLVERFGPMPPGRVIHVLEQACVSLAEAHAVGCVHRDIKPANLLLCRQGLELDFVKVLDFGLVKQLDASATQLSAVDSARGTPAFMAPEVIAGRAVDGRTDLYALGCVAHWLVAARHVFDARTAIEAMSHHARMPARSLVGVVDGMPRDLDALILSCLAKSPEERPASAAELRAALRQLESYGTWTEEDAEAWWLRHAETPLARATPRSPSAVSATADTVQLGPASTGTANTEIARPERA